MKWDIVFVQNTISFLFLVMVFLQLIFRRKKLGKKIGYFIIAMVVIVLANTISFGYRIFIDQLNSTPIFVVLVNGIGFLFFFLYYYNLQKIKKVKILQGVIIGIFVTGYILYGLLSKDFFIKFPSYSYFFECILLIISITMFFYETFNSDIILNITKYFPFWVSLSLIIIYIGLLPILLFINRVNSNLSAETFHLILFLINIIGYSVLFYGILKSNKINYER